MATLIIVEYIVWGVAWALTLWVKKMNAKEIKKQQNTNAGQVAKIWLHSLPSRETVG